MNHRTAMCVVFLSVLLCTAVATHAATWTKTYSPDRSATGQDVLLLEDGGFLIVSTSTTQTYPTRITCITLLRLTPDGDIVWQRSYAASPFTFGRSAVASDGGFVVAGNVQSETGTDTDFFLLHVDGQGNEIWSRTYAAALDEYVFELLAAEDGGYVLIGNSVDPNDLVIENTGTSGYSGYAGRSNPFIIKTDADGQEVWSQRFASNDNAITTGGALTSDHGIVVLSYILHFPILDEDIRLFCVDADGNMNWSRDWTKARTSGYDMMRASNGDFVISGEISRHGDPERALADALVIRVDPQGNELWQATIGEEDSVETAHVITETAGGQIVVAGWQMPNLNTATDNILFASLNSDGSPSWQDVEPTTAHNLFGGIIEHTDGSYVLVSSAGSWNTRFRVKLTKIDPSPSSDEP